MDDQKTHPDEELDPLSDDYSNNPNNPSSTNQVDSDYSEDAEDDLRNFGIYQCLPVDQQDPDWDLEEPDTAEEYLRRVRFEANQLPAIVTNPPPPPPLQPPPAPQQLHPSRLRIPIQDTTLPECDPSMKPTIPWIRHFLASFDKLRRQLQKEEDYRAGRIDIDGGGGGGISIKVSPAAMTESMRRKMQYMVLKGPSGSMKELRVLRGLDQLTIQRRLTNRIHSVLISNRDVGVEEEDNEGGQQDDEDISMGEAIPVAEEEEEAAAAAVEPVAVAVVERNIDNNGKESSPTRMTISASTAKEIYALSARLEKPIRADIAALYSALLKHCIKIRASMRMGGQLVVLPDDPGLAYINILIVIAGGYFGQDKELSSVGWEEEEEEGEEGEEVVDLLSLL